MTFEQKKEKKIQIASKRLFKKNTDIKMNKFTNTNIY